MGVIVRAPFGKPPFQIDFKEGIKRSVKDKKGAIHFRPGTVYRLTDDEWDYIKEKHHNVVPDFLVMGKFDDSEFDEKNPEIKSEVEEKNIEETKVGETRVLTTRKKTIRKELTAPKETGLVKKGEEGISTT